MLARLVLDEHYGDFDALTLALADVLAEQVAGLPCACIQVDEANLPATPQDSALAAQAINIFSTASGRARRASLLRQLRRPDHPQGHWAR